VADKTRKQLCYNHDLRLSAQHWQEELNPEGIQRDLTRLFENPQEGPMRCDVDWQIFG